MAAFWTPLSVVFHATLAYALVASVTCTPDPIGSQEIELDVIAPRLAPPLRVNGNARDLSRGHTDAEQGRRASAAPHARPAPKQGAEEQRAKETPAKQTVAQRVKETVAQRARKAPAATAKKREGQERPRPAISARGARRPPTERERPRTRPEDDLLRTMAAVDPDGTIPFHVAKSATQERKKRRALRAERLAASRASDARVSRTLARMNAAARAENAGGRLGGGGRGRGSLPRIGLRFYLSGRRVASSRVVRPPEPLRLPRKACKVRRLGLPPTTVRMLVSKDGDVTVAYINRRSGDRRFDRCAREMAREMRFRPGEDLAGNPLNVWIHLIVEPRARPTAVAGGPLGG